MFRRNRSTQSLPSKPNFLDSLLPSIVEHMPVNLMVADSELVIRYVNAASLSTLRAIEHLLPCRAEEVAGQSIDLFHRDPAHQRSMLADDRNLPYHARIQLADEELDLHISALTDRTGQRLGLFVTWDVVTEKARFEKQAAERAAIVENVPVNIVVADREGTIQYINPASERTLREIEHELPLPVDQLLGASYDVFHRVPERVRQIVADPSNLPHEAQITLGNEILSLKASAVLDHEGNYSGPMVTWAVITEQVRMREREEQQQERERREQDELREKVDRLLGVVRAAASGDLTVSVDVEGTDAIGELAAGLRTMIGDLRTMIGEVTSNTSQCNEASQVIAEGAQSLATTAQAHASAISDMSDASKRLTTSINAVRDSADQADGVARTTNRLATEGHDAVGQSIEAMRRIEQSAQQIEDVLAVIAEIASQTNLLALNAAIEAARAGEHGMGFAVVADEVRKLAARAADATEQVGTLVRESTTRITEGWQLSEKTGRALAEILEGVESTAARISEIAEATREQAISAEQVAQAITEASAITETVAAGSEEMASSSEQLGAQSASLAELVNRFRCE